MRKKIGAIVMFALGASACVAATYKLAVFGIQWGRVGYVDPRWMNQQLSLVIPPQFDTYGYTMWIPTQAELSAAMIGSSLIALRPYLQRSIRSVTNAFGSLVTGSQAAKESMQPHTHTQGAGVAQPRSADKYLKMNNNEGVMALNSEFELRDLDWEARI